MTWSKEDCQYKSTVLHSPLLWVTGVWSHQCITQDLIKCILELITQRTKGWNPYPPVLIPCHSRAVSPVFTPWHHKLYVHGCTCFPEAMPCKTSFLLEMAGVAVGGVRVWDAGDLKGYIRNVQYNSWHMEYMLWAINMIILLPINCQIS